MLCIPVNWYLITGIHSVTLHQPPLTLITLKLAPLKYIKATFHQLDTESHTIKYITLLWFNLNLGNAETSPNYSYTCLCKRNSEMFKLILHASQIVQTHSITLDTIVGKGNVSSLKFKNQKHFSQTKNSVVSFENLSYAHMKYFWLQCYVKQNLQTKLGQCPVIKTCNHFWLQLLS